MNTSSLTPKSIIASVRSIHDFFNLVIQYWAANGYKVSLTSYPTFFSHHVSCTHVSPAGKPTNWGSKPHLPTGYPAFTGTISGTIERTKKDTDKSFWRLCEDFFPIKLHTGGGGNGTFSYGCTIFIEDLPLIYEEYLRTGGAIQHISTEYEIALDDFRNVYKVKQQEYISNNPVIQQFNNLEEQAITLFKDIDKAVNNYSKYLENKFVEENPITIPPLDSAFTDTSSDIYLTANSPTPVMPETQPVLQKIHSLIEDLQTYKKKYPEVFL